MSDFILVLFAIFIVFGVFRRYLFFLVMNAVSKKLFKEMQKQQGHPYAHNRNQEGKVKVDVSSRKQSTRIHHDNDGEYVDYEEIKD
ncbi:MAG: DUF4834 family protein [Bacteroidota bacterium]